jgi:hypothetical protein
MDIYIDESGPFLTSPNRPHRVSAVVALVIPSARSDELFVQFARCVSRWGLTTEVKGSRLSEPQIAEVIALLSSFDTVVEIQPIDMSMHDPGHIADYRRAQAQGIVEHLTSEHRPNLVRQVHSLKDACMSVPDQLFVQLALTIALISEVYQTATMYYAQRLPEELGAFHWVVDAKDSVPTTVEELWSTLLLPMMQSRSFSRPFVLLKGADYSHFRRFEIREMGATGELLADIGWHKQHMAAPWRDVEYTGRDLREVMRDLRFCDSRSEPGLQLADIVASAFCRGCNGTLKRTGWENIGSLVVRRTGGSVRPALLRVSLDAVDPEASTEFARVAGGIEDRAKSMILARKE